MADVSLAATWVFMVDADEASLILMGLGGRLRDPADIEAARVLGDHLTRIRANNAKQLANQMAIHASKIGG